MTGASLYATHCARCHGSSGGGGSGGDLLGLALSVDEVALIVNSGPSEMPSYRDRLGVAEIEAVARYVLDAF